MAYTKLFSSILTSTIWSEDHATRIVWISMLALCNQHGEVQASIPGLARVSGVSIPDTEAAIARFLSPDTYSRTPDDDGRRIEKVEGGWVLLNYGKYRAMEMDDDRRDRAAERKRRQRDRDARNGKSQPCHAESHDVTECHKTSRQIPQAEAEAEAEAPIPTEEERKAPAPPDDDDEDLPEDPPPPPPPKRFTPPTEAEWLAYAATLNPAWGRQDDAAGAWTHYQANGWKVGRVAMKDWQSAAQNCHRRWKADRNRPLPFNRTTPPNHGSATQAALDQYR